MDSFDYTNLFNKMQPKLVGKQRSQHKGVGVCVCVLSSTKIVDISWEMKWITSLGGDKFWDFIFAAIEFTFTTYTQVSNETTHSQANKQNQTKGHRIDKTFCEFNWVCQRRHTHTQARIVEIENENREAEEISITHFLGLGGSGLGVRPKMCQVPIAWRTGKRGDNF